MTIVVEESLGSTKVKIGSRVITREEYVQAHVQMSQNILIDRRTWPNN